MHLSKAKEQLEPAVAAKCDRLADVLRDCGRTLVAFSGGVDSALLAVAAHDVLGDDMLAVTGLSASYPEQDREDARELARRFGFPLRVVETHELEVEGYRENSPNRCYFCKTELFSTLAAIAQREGYDTIADGTNTSDQGDHRPGRRAAGEQRVRSPLAEAGMSKEDIRAVSKALELPTWSKPAMACLASRFAYGQGITAERLGQVGRCEALLYRLGCRSLRVRFHGEVARIEVEAEQMPLLLAHRDEIVETFKREGFVYVTLDLQGFRSGSMNEVLRAASRPEAG